MLLTLLPPTKEEVHVFARVCLFVCLSVCTPVRGTSINDVTLEGGSGVPTFVTICDVGGGG